MVIVFTGEAYRGEPSFHESIMQDYIIGSVR
jgi:hypothetical protein